MSVLSWKDVFAEAGRYTGHVGRDMLDIHLEDRPDATPDEVLAWLRENPTSLQTSLFRNENLEALAGVAPALLERLGGTTLRVGQIAASEGKETLSLAALLHGVVSFEIHGFDINPGAVERARDLTLSFVELRILQKEDEKRERHGRPTLADRVERLIERLPDGTARVNDAFRAATAFDVHDLLEGPLPGGPYGAVIANNLLYHYEPGPRDTMVANLVASMAVGAGLYTGMRPGAVGASL